MLGTYRRVKQFKWKNTNTLNFSSIFHISATDLESNPSLHTSSFNNIHAITILTQIEAFSTLSRARFLLNRPNRKKKHISHISKNVTYQKPITKEQTFIFYRALRPV